MEIFWLFGYEIEVVVGEGYWLVKIFDCFYFEEFCLGFEMCWLVWDIYWFESVDLINWVV